MARPELALPYIAVPVSSPNANGSVQITIRAKSPGSTSGIQYKYTSILEPEVDCTSVTTNAYVTLGCYTDHLRINVVLQGDVHEDSSTYTSDWIDWGQVNFSRNGDTWTVQVGSTSVSKQWSIYWEPDKLNTPTLTVNPAHYYKYNTAVNYSWNSVAANQAKYRLNDGTTEIDRGFNLSYSRTFGVSSVGQTYYAKVKAVSNDSKYADSDWSASKSFTIAGTYKLIDGLDTSHIYRDWVAVAWKENDLTPSKTNYTFAGWWTAASGGTQVRAWEATSSKPDLVLYAHWNASNYTIQLDPQGGTVDGSTTTKSYSVVVGNSFTFNKTVVAPTGKVFKGWSKTVNGEVKYVNGNSYTPTSSETWCAVYGDNSVISFNLNAPTKIGTTTKFGTSPTTISDMTKTYGQAITLPVAQCTGFTFKGWSNGSTTIAGGAAYNIEGSTTLEAVWKQNEYSWSEIAPSFGPPLPAIDVIEQWWKFNTTITLRPVWSTSDYDQDKWLPADKFWKVTNGTNTIGSFAPEATFHYNNQDWAKHGNKIQSQWTQVTNWRGAFGENGGLWIYIGNPGEEE